MTQLPDARITKSTVSIGGNVLISNDIIVKDGITVTPGGAKDVNRLTVVFLVGNVTIEDSTT